MDTFVPIFFRINGLPIQLGTSGAKNKLFLAVFRVFNYPVLLAYKCATVITIIMTIFITVLALSLLYVSGSHYLVYFGLLIISSSCPFPL